MAEWCGSLLDTPLLLLTSAVAVNSRCIYFDVNNSSPADNLTLGPIIDMMNHQSGRLTKPIQKSDTLSFSTPTFGSPDSKFEIGSELVFSYGGHEWYVIVILHISGWTTDVQCSPMLLAEYGFCLSTPTDSDRGNAYNHLQIDDQVKALFSTDSHGAEKRGLLENNGYWGSVESISSLNYF